MPKFTITDKTYTIIKEIAGNQTSKCLNAITKKFLFDKEIEDELFNRIYEIIKDIPISGGYIQGSGRKKEN